MAELLPDNLELARRSSESPNVSSCSSRTVRRRELSHDQNGLMAWSVCFSTFAAIIGQKHPHKVKELLAYQATIVIEALRFNGRGWLPYDKMFRENVAKHPDTDWSTINPMFYSLTYLNQKVEARTCTKCMGPDHSLHECALNSLDQPQLLTPPLTPSAPSASYSRVQEPRFRQQCELLCQPCFVGNYELLSLACSINKHILALSEHYGCLYGFAYTINGEYHSRREI